MAEKLTIEIFRKKDAGDFTTALADPESRLQLGSGAAMTAAVSAAELERAACLLSAGQEDDERLNYLRRNCGILRDYMVRLIDEDVKCHGPLRRALKQTAVAICEEIINMMGKGLEFAEELIERPDAQARCYAVSAADLAMAALQSAMRYIEYLADMSPDDTYRYVIHRENEITLQDNRARYERITAALKS